MTDLELARKTLEEIYLSSQKVFRTQSLHSKKAGFTDDVNLLIADIDNNKSLIGVIITSLLKKILSPEQDIRLHKVEFEGGYSARVLDTKVTAPFFKKYFLKYSNKETSFLTKTTRSDVEFTFENETRLSIRNKPVRKAFINIIESVQRKKFTAKECIQYFFVKLIELKEQQEKFYQKELIQIESKIKKRKINIDDVISLLIEHFKSPKSSRLPVIAIYSIYKLLVINVKRYSDKKLLPLQVHSSSDKRGYGDIEIYTDKNEPFEIIEIKHSIPINIEMIIDIIKKTGDVKIDRYYILSTYKNGFENTSVEKEVKNRVNLIRLEKGLDIIPNGIISSIKYYLRMIDNYEEFLSIYKSELIEDSKRSTSVNIHHIEKWDDILKDGLYGDEEKTYSIL